MIPSSTEPPKETEKPANTLAPSNTNKPTSNSTCTPSNKQNLSENVTSSEKKTEEDKDIVAKKSNIIGQQILDKRTKAIYIVIKSSKTDARVKYIRPKSKKVKKVVIPAKISHNGKSYKVTVIGDSAFKGCTKLKKVTIGKNIIKIDKFAFRGCKKLDRITIKTKKLSIKNVKNRAFKGIHPKARINVPKNKIILYKKMLRKRGIKKKQRINF